MLILAASQTRQCPARQGWLEPTTTKGQGKKRFGAQLSAHWAYQSHTGRLPYSTRGARSWTISLARKKQGSFGAEWQLSGLQDARLLSVPGDATQRHAAQSLQLCQPPLLPLPLSPLAATLAGEHPPRAPRRAAQAAGLLALSGVSKPPLALAVTQRTLGSLPSRHSQAWGWEDSALPGSQAGTMVWKEFGEPEIKIGKIQNDPSPSGLPCSLLPNLTWQRGPKEAGPQDSVSQLQLGM